MLKRQNNLMAAFSMASMTDVIFLLLIFFMVTSTFVFPTGLEVNLPQSTQQSAIKPVTKVYIDSNDSIFAATGQDRPQPVSLEALPVFLKMANEQVMKSLTYAYVGRRLKKRDFRSLWITRINAAARLNGMSYSTFINGLKKHNICLLYTSPSPRD